MVDQQGRLKILDFGIARVAEDNRTRVGLPLTQVNMMIGTPGYMSPEQIEGGEVDHRSDIFAVGAVCYELLSYSEAFAGGNTRAGRTAGAAGKAGAAGVVVPGLDPEIDEIIQRALKRDPNKRYQDAATFEKALERVRVRLGPDEAPKPPVRPTPPPPQSTGGEIARGAGRGRLSARARRLCEQGSRDRRAGSRSKRSPRIRRTSPLARCSQRLEHPGAAPQTRAASAAGSGPRQQSVGTSIGSTAIGSTAIDATSIGATSVGDIRWGDAVRHCCRQPATPSRLGADNHHAAARGTNGRRALPAMVKRPKRGDSAVAPPPPAAAATSAASWGGSGAQGAEPTHDAVFAVPLFWPALAVVLAARRRRAGRVVVRIALGPSGQQLTIAKPTAARSAAGIRAAPVALIVRAPPAGDPIELTPKPIRASRCGVYRRLCARWTNHHDGPRTCGATFVKAVVAGPPAEPCRC